MTLCVRSWPESHHHRRILIQPFPLAWSLVIFSKNAIRFQQELSSRVWDLQQFFGWVSLPDRASLIHNLTGMISPRNLPYNLRISGCRRRVFFFRWSSNCTGCRGHQLWVLLLIDSSCTLNWHWPVRTEQYQAMYRVLNAFALMNAVLSEYWIRCLLHGMLTCTQVIFACLTLLFLALRRHRNGEDHMWHGPVTSCAWFNTYGNLKKNKQAKTSSSSILPVAVTKVEAPAPPMKDKSGPESPHRKQSSHSRKEYASEKRSRLNVPPPPSKKSPTRHDSGRSGTSKSSTVPRSLKSEIDNGLMLHPNDLKRSRQWNI